MIALRLAINELRRLTAGRLPKVALLGVTIVPLLYGGLYLYANWDPYSHLNQVPAALVVADRGTTTDGKRLEVGKDVADELLHQGRFDWHKVSAKEAEDGVRKGEYDFAVTLPADFSEALASPAKFEARQGMITLTTNDANSYTGTTIAHKVVEEVRRAVAAKVGRSAADRLLIGFSTIQEKTQEAANGSTKLADGARKALDGATKLADGNQRLAEGAHKLYDGSQQLVDGTTQAAGGARQLENGANRLSDGLGKLRDGAKELPAQSARLASGARQVADGDQQFADEAAPIAKGAQDFVARMQTVRDDIAAALAADGTMSDADKAVLAGIDAKLALLRQANQRVQDANANLRKLATGSRQVADGANQLAAAAPRLTNGIGQAADGADRLSTGADQLTAGAEKLHAGSATLHDKLGQAATGADKLADGSGTLRDGSSTLADGSHKLADGLAKAAGQIPNPDDPTRSNTAKVIGDPVAVRDVGQVTADTYGAGLAPFFLGLAMWVGAFTLFMLVRPLSRRALSAGAPARRVALGGWLPAAAIGAAQVLALFTFAALVIGVSPARPVATLAFMLLTTLAFTAVVHALNAFFGPAGKFLALILLVLQLTTAGGTFPWQTTPGPLHPLHLALPLSYVVDGLRHLLYGGSLSSMGMDVGVLLGYLLVGLALSTYAGRKHRIWTGSRLRPELVL